jgi:uncharacterized membrane protein SpoIIM required for sporulation
MFFYIAYKNIMVSFKMFAAGALLSVGTLWLLFTNGVMVGTFQYLFYQKGLLATSALAIWLHGTIEISVIVIAGCAGLVMGGGILFPRTLTRAQSFNIAAREGMKIVIGLIPFFLIAAFIESFVTRHTEMPAAVNLAIIIASLGFIIWYFILYPIQLHRSIQPHEPTQLHRGTEYGNDADLLS